MSFIGSSERWGEQATARLCQLVIQSNDGMAQQIADNHQELLDLYSLEELQRTDDLGLSLPFLAIFYDQPDALRYLHKRGMDLSKPCDPMGFGTPYFYAVTLGKSRLLQTLNSLLYSYTLPCETLFNYTPVYYASRRDDMYLLDTIKTMIDTERWAFNLIYKNYLRAKCVNRYRKMYKSTLLIQRVGRGYLSRIRVKLMRSGTWSIGDTGSVKSSASSAQSSAPNSMGAGNKSRGEKKDKDEISIYSATAIDSIVGGESLVEGSGED